MTALVPDFLHRALPPRDLPSGAGRPRALSPRGLPSGAGRPRALPPRGVPRRAPLHRARGWVLALVAALVLGACDVGGALPAAPDDPDSTTARIQTTRGPLFASVWEADAPRAVILALHGFGDYADTAFGGAAPEWAARGITVYAYDQRGFGRNPSNRRWAGDDALVADLAEVAAEVAARHPDLPLFVAGHSMGGAVALATGGEGRLPHGTRLILLAPGLWGGDSLGLGLRAVAWAGAALIPDVRFSAAAAPVTIRPTDNIDELRRLSRDPLRFANPSARELMGLIRLMDRALAVAPQAPGGTLTVMGAHDEVVPEESVRMGHTLLSEPKTFAYVESGWHMLLIDLEGEVVRDLVTDWVLDEGVE